VWETLVSMCYVFKMYIPNDASDSNELFHILIIKFILSYIVFHDKKWIFGICKCFFSIALFDKHLGN
jgi:hypothetical protein